MLSVSPSLDSMQTGGRDRESNGTTGYDSGGMEASSMSPKSMPEGFTGGRRVFANKARKIVEGSGAQGSGAFSRKGLLLTPPGSINSPRSPRPDLGEG